MSIPDPIWLFRITHFQNVRYMLEQGLHTVRSTLVDPEFISIGDHTLINVRKDKAVPVPPYGNLSDYIPFYFGTHSPMLLQIRSGNQGVMQRPQEEIVYLVTNLDKLEKASCSYVFSDGHAWDRASVFYHKKRDLANIDWALVKEKYWANTEEDMDRQRRKQAELMVYQHIPANCLTHILVYDEEKRNFIQEQVSRFQPEVQVAISPKHYY